MGTGGISRVVPSGSDGNSEEAGDERNLAEDIVFRYPSNLVFADHVYRLDTLNRAARRIEGPEALTGSHSSFDRPVILLHYIVQESDRSTATAAAQISRVLEFSDDLWI
jgi:hypothetical protein